MAEKYEALKDSKFFSTAVDFFEPSGEAKNGNTAKIMKWDAYSLIYFLD